MCRKLRYAHIQRAPRYGLGVSWLLKVDEGVAGPPSLTQAMFPTWLWRSCWPCVCKGQGSAERASCGRELPLLRWLITVIQIFLALEGTSLCKHLPTLLASQPSAARHAASGFCVWSWGCWCCCMCSNRLRFWVWIILCLGLSFSLFLMEILESGFIYLLAVPWPGIKTLFHALEDRFYLFQKKIFIFLIGGKIALQVHSGFCPTTMRKSVIIIYIHSSLLNLFPLPLSSPFRSQCARLGSLCYWATSH